MRDDLGKRMKEQYEIRTRYMLPRRTYTLIRLDGKAFHTFTQKMKKPFDLDFMEVMTETAKFLCEEIQGAQMAYVQSDEISLLLTDFTKITTDAWFDGNIQKMASVSASIATAKFNQLMMVKACDNFDGDDRYKNLKYWEIDEFKLAFFDSRVWTIPDPIEVENYFIWRQKDAVRNSISMAAQSLYSDKELKGKSSSEKQDMIHAKGMNWNNLPDGFKRGRTIYKVHIYDTEIPGGGVLDLGAEWKVLTPDFLKERGDLSNLIPRIGDNE